MRLHAKRAGLTLAALVLTFVVFRAALHVSPDANLNLGSYNIHHLFVGLILIALGGIPLAIFSGEGRWLDGATVLFGVGLGMALDEWVYLITTDGSDASYLLPISFRGGLAMIGLACAYAAVLIRLGRPPGK